MNIDYFHLFYYIFLIWIIDFSDKNQIKEFSQDINNNLQINSFENKNLLNQLTYAKKLVIISKNKQLIEKFQILEEFLDSDSRIKMEPEFHNYIETIYLIEKKYSKTNKILKQDLQIYLECLKSLVPESKDIDEEYIYSQIELDQSQKVKKTKINSYIQKQNIKLSYLEENYFLSDFSQLKYTNIKNYIKKFIIDQFQQIDDQNFDEIEFNYNKKIILKIFNQIINQFGISLTLNNEISRTNYKYFELLQDFHRFQQFYHKLTEKNTLQNQSEIINISKTLDDLQLLEQIWKKMDDRLFFQIQEKKIEILYEQKKYKEIQINFKQQYQELSQSNSCYNYKIDQIEKFTPKFQYILLKTSIKSQELFLGIIHQYIIDGLLKYTDKNFQVKVMIYHVQYLKKVGVWKNVLRQIYNYYNKIDFSQINPKLAEKCAFSFVQQCQDSLFTNQDFFDLYLELQLIVLKYGCKYLTYTFQNVIRDIEKALKLFPNVDFQQFFDGFLQIDTWKFTFFVKTLLPRLLSPFKQLRNFYIRILIILMNNYIEVILWEIYPQRQVSQQFKEIIDLSIFSQLNKTQKQYLQKFSQFIDLLINLIKQKSLQKDISKIMQKINNFCKNNQVLMPLVDTLNPTLPCQLQNNSNYNPYVNLNRYFKYLEPNIQKMKSLVAPIVLSFLDQNNNKKKFLLKMEDVQQDCRKEQRISSLIKQLNDIFLRKHYLKKGFHMTTYNIVSLNLRINLIEFLDNTTTLQSIVDVDKKRQQISNKKLTEDFWIQNKGPKFELKNFLFQISDEKQNFFEVLINFTKTCAIWSAFGFFIGLGDRHLSNIMMNQITGEIIHIDFDSIFNKSRSLPVPERVDFRMTNNIQNGLGICSFMGLFYVYFKETLKIFYDEQQEILALLEIFNLDPLQEQSSITNSYFAEMNFIKNLELNEKQIQSLILKCANPNFLKEMFHGWNSHLQIISRKLLFLFFKKKFQIII